VHGLKEVLEILGSMGTMKQIKETLPEPCLKQIEELWTTNGNISWFEAFAIWLLELRKNQDPWFKTPWE
jgi:hypothetical protein